MTAQFKLIVKTILVIIMVFTLSEKTLASEQVFIEAFVPGCGDEIVTPPEQCDGLNLEGNTCQSLGFFGGFLSCNNDCTFNTSQCFTDPGTTSQGFLTSGFRFPKPEPIPPFRPSFPDSCMQSITFQQYLDCIFLQPVVLEPSVPSTLDRSGQPVSTDGTRLDQVGASIDQEELQDEDFDTGELPSWMRYTPIPGLLFFAEERPIPLFLVIFMSYAVFHFYVRYRLRKLGYLNKKKKSKRTKFY